jgi:hypothetical protein
MVRQADKLQEKIDSLTGELDELHKASIPLFHPAVVTLSKKLDALILQWYEPLEQS